MAFHSVSRLLFHDWIPWPIAATTTRTKEDQEEEEEVEEKLAFPLDVSLGSLYPPNNHNNGTDVPAGAEQALLRVSLILHENTTGTTGTTVGTIRANKRRRFFDPRVRAAARTLASELRSRRGLLRGRHLLARSSLLVVDHGLANGSLDGLRERFPPLPPLPSPSTQMAKRSRGSSGDIVFGGRGGGDASDDGDSPQTSWPRPHGDDFAGFGSNGADGFGGFNGYGGGTGGGGGEQLGGGREGGSKAASTRGQETAKTTRPSKDMLQYASAVYFLAAVSC